MPESDDMETWRRLGRMLELRRVELATRYSNLSLFTAERGLDYRLAWDIEHAKRTNYRRPTLTAVEIAYGWRPGSIAGVLAGGRPAPAPDPDGPAVLEPACMYERLILAEDLADDVKQSIIRAHRSKGHNSWCDPGPVRSGAVPGALSAAGN
jgi:hypothetical protein